jgi:hypothetical protein
MSNGIEYISDGEVNESLNSYIEEPSLNSNDVNELDENVASTSKSFDDDKNFIQLLEAIDSPGSVNQLIQRLQAQYELQLASHAANLAQITVDLQSKHEEFEQNMHSSQDSRVSHVQDALLKLEATFNEKLQSRRDQLRLLFSDECKQFGKKFSDELVGVNGQERELAKSVSESFLTSESHRLNHSAALESVRLNEQMLVENIFQLRMMKQTLNSETLKNTGIVTKLEVHHQSGLEKTASLTSKSFLSKKKIEQVKKAHKKNIDELYMQREREMQIQIQLNESYVNQMITLLNAKSHSSEFTVPAMTLTTEYIKVLRKIKEELA